jgi:hypothetical protein
MDAFFVFELERPAVKRISLRGEPIDKPDFS